MSLWGRKLQEMARALCVVALLFLNFAHVPLAAGGEVVAAPIAAGFCGNPLHGQSTLRATLAKPAGSARAPTCRLGRARLCPHSKSPTRFTTQRIVLQSSVASPGAMVRNALRPLSSDPLFRASSIKPC